MDLEIEKIMVIAGRSGAAGYALGGDILGRYREAVGGQLVVCLNLNDSHANA